MSSFEDIETQNARRFWDGFRRLDALEVPRGREARRVRRALERAAGASSGVEVEHAVLVLVPPPRQPRTALGFGLLGPVAPPAPTLPSGGWLVYLPGGVAVRLERQRTRGALRRGPVMIGHKARGVRLWLDVWPRQALDARKPWT